MEHVGKEIGTLVENRQKKEFLDPAKEIEAARGFFRDLGIPLDKDGLISRELTPEQIEKLADWRRQTMEGGIEMPTEKIFYNKVFVAISLWRQKKEGGGITYILGKGTGVEIALRGNVRGREKRQPAFPYRSHSDFELYAVDVGIEVYSPAFMTVFGAQEYFPPTKTKGLSHLPPDLLHKTCETVDLGGIDILIPELELMYLDKRFASEATPREDGYDHELLAKRYVLDTEKVLQYLNTFVLPGMRNKIEETYSPEKAASQIAGIKKYMRMYEREHELLSKTEPADWANALNSLFETHLHMEMSDISSLYWVTLTDADFTPDRQLADEAGLKTKIQDRILQDRKLKLQKIEEIGESERTFLESMQ